MKPGRTVWLGLLFAICIARLWLMALPSSFWVDETVTAFVVQHPDDPSLAVAPQVPASIYYWLPRIALKLGGSSEIVYRTPSVLAMLAAIWMLSRLAALLIHPEAGWLAAFACLGLTGMDYFAVDARPYALGMLISVASGWFLVRWLDGARWQDAAAFVVCAGLLWRVHLVYWPFYLVLGLYTVARLAAGKSPVGWWRAVAVYAGLGLLLAPVALQALAVEHQARAHVIAIPPSWRDFLHLLRWNLVFIAGVGAWIFQKLSSLAGQSAAAPSDNKKRPAPLGALLIFAWWLVLPVLLFGLSVSTSESVYLTRYLSLALPGAALTATWVAARLLPPGRWNAAAALMGLGALVMLGHWGTVWPVHEKSGWRNAAAEVNRRASGEDLPVICTSPFIEGHWPEWWPNYPLPGFLYSQLAYYPLHARVILFPFEDANYLRRSGDPASPAEPRAKVYATQLLSGILLSRGEFLIYGGSSSVRFWQRWFAARPEVRGWENRRDEFGDVFVARFRAPGKPAPADSRLNKD